MKPSIFKEVFLYYSKDQNGTYIPTDFGLRKFFTEQTQWFYGTDSEILYVLNVLNGIPEDVSVINIKDIILYNNMCKIDCMFNDKIDDTVFAKPDEKIYDETVAEMKRILQLLDIEYEEGLPYQEMYDKYFNHSKYFDTGNYFWDFTQGKRILHYYQKQEALIKEYLKQREKTSS